MNQNTGRLFENIAQPFALCEVLFDNNNTPIDYIFLEVNDRWAELLSMPKENNRQQSI